LESETAYIIAWGQWIIGDSRQLLKGKPEDMSPVELCKTADWCNGGNVQMITYTPVDVDGEDVYAVYQTEGIPVRQWGRDPVAVALVKANGTLVGYVQRVMAP
jgi:hypothetical protein